ncbi:MAG: hypothetical protein FGM24_00620 [Candidatus Kapabacteria bacterium]|nr:hypothetical protein [Candidatus Kapabacteria bacterium]
MKRTLLAAAAVMTLAAVSASAQMLSAGAGLLYKGGFNGGTIRDGRKTDLNFNGMVDLSAIGLLRFSKTSDMGFMLEIGTAEYSFRMRPQDEDVATDANTGVYSISKFAVTPSLYLGGFTLGASFGFGDTQTVENVDGSAVDMLRSFTDFGQVVVVASPTIELRIGGMIPLWKHDDGVLNLNLSAGYMLPGLYDNGGDNNAKPVSAGIGLNYLFTAIR